MNEYSINKELWFNLRRCQKESINKSIDYSKSVLDDKNKSCLISLPTGAGKSGVISVVSHTVNQNKILVLCHRRAVCNQLYAEINGKFFREKAPNGTHSLKKVYNKIDDTDADGIYVSTFQKLQRFTKLQLDKLKKDIDLVIVDEGHAEPSPVWRTLVRGMNAHKIVITATPYRNDLFQFDINPKFSYIYTFDQALEDKILKEPSFISREKDDLGKYIRDFLDSNPGTKCIIKCNKFEDIESYYSNFNDKFELLAVHEQFKNDSRENVKSSVPANLSESSYEIIIHQKKLDEGVDIPQAKLLVLSYAVNSGRELVQTIGRVVRLYKEYEPIVLEIGQDANMKMWENYRKFDNSLNDSSAIQKFIASLDANKLIESYLDSFPDVSYYDKGFALKFDINKFDPDRSLNIPTASVCFLTKKKGFSSGLLADNIYWKSSNNGELCKQFETRFDIFVILSIAFNSSKFIKDHFFFEPSLEVTLFKEIGENILAIYDSRGRKFSKDDDPMLGGAISQDQLLKIIAKGAFSVAKETTGKSVNSAARRPERLAQKSPDLNKMIDQQANASYRLSNATLDIFDKHQMKSGSYYIGVDSGRISDQRDFGFSLWELDDWFNDIGKFVSSDVSVSNLFLDSYAKPINVDTNLKIESVIFDFSEIKDEVKIYINDEPYNLELDFLYRNYDNGFLLFDSVEDSFVSITLNLDEPYLRLSLGESITYFIGGKKEPYGRIEQFLFQYIHKALLENGIGYANEKFYQLKIPTDVGFDLSSSNLASVMYSVNKLQSENLDEKGYKNGKFIINNEEFCKDSIFYLLDMLKANSLDNPTRDDLGPFASFIPDVDIVLNTDMGTEPADFILSSNQKLVYVHVKCDDKKRPMSSAGALAEVGSQAIKNIGMLISSELGQKPGNWTRLKTAWPSENAKERIQERIRIFNGKRFTAKDDFEREDKLNEVWDVIARRRRSTAVQKEVWIVVGNAFSLQHFQDQLASGKANSESLQAYQLVSSWLSTAHNNDVALKIFVSE